MRVMMRFLMTLLTYVTLLTCAAASPATDEPGKYYVAINASRVLEANFKAAPGATIATEDTQVAAAFARFRYGKALIDVGFDYQYTHFDYEEVNSRDRDLHRVQLPVWFSVPGETWQVRGHVAPGIFTSSNVLGDFFKRGSSDDWYASARVEAIAAGASVPWLLGVAHDRSFGASKTYPVIGLSLAPNEAIDLRLAWPDPRIRVRFSERHAASLRVFPAGGKWHVRTDDFSEEFDYRFEAWRSQLGWNARLYKWLSLDLSVGYESDRSHKFDDTNGARIDASAGDEWFYAIGIRIGDAPLPLAHGAHLNR